MLSCLSVALLSPPSFSRHSCSLHLWQPLMGKKLLQPQDPVNHCKLSLNSGLSSPLYTYFWPSRVLVTLYTLSFTFLSALIGWSDWANPVSFWHSLCCQRYSGSCSGKLTLKFPLLMNMWILPITSKYYGANRWWEKVNWSARGCHLVMIPTSRIIYKEMCST